MVETIGVLNLMERSVTNTFVERTLLVEIHRSTINVTDFTCCHVSSVRRCEAVGVDIKKVKLTDFMKALGQEHPVAADGNLRIYNAPYDDKPGPTMVINIQTNLWRDTKSGAYGGIYDLAYELTGSCNMSELNRYIASEMSALEKSKDKEQKTEPPKQEPEPDKPKRKMRL